MSALRDYVTVTTRHSLHLLRSPLSIAFALVQPIIWLVLYGQLFSRVKELTEFHQSSYISFLTPGIIAMSTLFSSGWVGIGITRDLENGVLERLLASPVSRGAIIVGRLMNLAITVTAQSLILLTLGLLLGARYSMTAYWSWIIVVVASILLGTFIGGLSLALAAITRTEQVVIGGVNFMLLPMAFLSPVLIAPELMPGWMQAIAAINPVSWAVECSRMALRASGEWGQMLFQLAVLAAVAIVSVFLALRSFRSLQRSF